MTTARETFDPTLVDAETEALLADAATDAAWESHVDGSWMAEIAARIGADSMSIARIADSVATSPGLKMWMAGEITDDEARYHAVSIRNAAAGKMSGPSRRALYSQYAAICACIASAKLSGAYIHSAIRYSGADLSSVADTVRAEIPWSNVKALIDSGGIDRARRTGPGVL